MFLMVGFFKLSGDPRLVGLFDAIGFGQWFRYVTGSLEVLGALLLLIPRGGLRVVACGGDAGRGGNASWRMASRAAQSRRVLLRSYH
jgi:hypothetical protein